MCGSPFVFHNFLMELSNLDQKTLFMTKLSTFSKKKKLSFSSCCLQSLQEFHKNFLDKVSTGKIGNVFNLPFFNWRQTQNNLGRPKTLFMTKLSTKKLSFSSCCLQSLQEFHKNFLDKVSTGKIGNTPKRPKSVPH
jgi:hypothetical protein